VDRREPSILRRGKQFERIEKKSWRLDAKGGRLIFEKAVKHPGGRPGRIDILVDELEGFVSVVEIKATDWDRVKSHRVRLNLRRHARQVWRYIETYVEADTDVCAGIIYPKPPKDAALRSLIESFLNEEFIQVVWREEAKSK
jgi:hypothetical protein